MNTIKNIFDTPQSSGDVNSIIDKANIRELVEYERYCRDNGHFDRMEEAYADNAEINVSWFSGSGKDFVAKSRQAGIGAKHKIHNTIVWLNGDKAVAELLAGIMSPRFILEDVELHQNAEVRIVYRLQKHDGLWKIKNADCIYEKDWFVPTVPGKAIQLDNEKLQSYRESYKCLCYALSTRRMRSNQNLPGDDKPEITAKLYSEVSKWLLNE